MANFANSDFTNPNVQTRALRAYACLSHAAAAATFIPVQREQDIGNTAQDLPILNHIWSISSGVTGMAAGKVRTGRLRRLGRSWDFYNVYYIISTDPTTSPNQALLRLGRIPMIHGEFLVVRRSPSGHRLMDMRDVDTIKAISLIRRVCRVIRGNAGVSQNEHGTPFPPAGPVAMEGLRQDELEEGEIEEVEME